MCFYVDKSGGNEVEKERGLRDGNEDVTYTPAKLFYALEFKQPDFPLPRMVVNTRSSKTVQKR